MVSGGRGSTWEVVTDLTAVLPKAGSVLKIYPERTRAMQEGVRTYLSDSRH